jgi:hypothetical protein
VVATTQLSLLEVSSLRRCQVDAWPTGAAVWSGEAEHLRLELTGARLRRGAVYGGVDARDRAYDALFAAVLLAVAVDNSRLIGRMPTTHFGFFMP